VNFHMLLDFFVYAFYTVELRYSAIEGAEKLSHKIEVRTILRSILKVFLLKGPKVFRTKSRFALYRGALYRGSTVLLISHKNSPMHSVFNSNLTI
jgi:hypothetical protein